MQCFLNVRGPIGIFAMIDTIGWLDRGLSIQVQYQSIQWPVSAQESSSLAWGRAFWHIFVLDIVELYIYFSLFLLNDYIVHWIGHVKKCYPIPSTVIKYTFKKKDCTITNKCGKAISIKRDTCRKAFQAPHTLSCSCTHTKTYKSEDLMHFKVCWTSTNPRPACVYIQRCACKCQCEACIKD